MIAAALIWLGCAVAPKGLDSFGDCAAQDSLGCTDRDDDNLSVCAADGINDDCDGAGTGEAPCRSRCKVS